MAEDDKLWNHQQRLDIELTNTNGKWGNFYRLIFTYLTLLVYVRMPTQHCVTSLHDNYLTKNLYDQMEIEQGSTLAGSRPFAMRSTYLDE